MSPRLHTDFTEIQAHTAKCDFCEKHNKLTLYRCTECGQQICSVCWNKLSGDGIHLFGGGLAGEPDLNTYSVVNGEETGGDESQGRTRTRSTRRVITDDEAARAKVNADASRASKQQGKRNKVNMSTDNHETGLPALWPMVPARRLIVPRPAFESAKRETQRNSHLEVQNPRRDQQSIAQAYDDLERQAASTRYMVVDSQKTRHQARDQTLPNGLHQQTTHPAYLHAQPTVYRPRPGTDVDQQAAHSQYAFANNQPGNRQALRPAQPRVAQQQATQMAPPYCPPPRVDMDRQAARNQLAFVRRPDTNHQTHRQDQASITQLRAQTAAKMAQIAARNQQAFYLNQQAQQYANAEQMEARKISHQNERPVVNGDQGVARNQQVPNLNRLPPASGNHMVEMLVARDPQEAYFSRKQADYPSPPNSGIAQSWASHMNPFPLPAQAFPSVQHTAPPASRQFRHRVAIEDLLNGPSEDLQVRKRSPESLKAADVPLSPTEVEQVPRSHSQLDQYANGVSQLLNAAGQPGQADSARSVSPSSSKMLVAESEAAGTKPFSPHGPALSADADVARPRVDKHQARPDGLHSSSGVPNLAVSPRGHASYGHTSLQPDSGLFRVGSSAVESHGSTPSDGQSHPGPRLPMSDHAATYLNTWNSGRAALSSRSRSSTADVPPTQLRSPVPTMHPRSYTGVQDVQDTVAAGTKEGGAAEVSSPSVNSPISVTEDLTGIDAVMSDTDVEIHDDEESRRHKVSAANNDPWTIGMAKGAEMARARTPEPIPELRSDGRVEKHQRGEETGDGKPSKEQKVAGDVDVIDAKERKGKESLSEKIDDHDGSDIEIISWTPLNSNKTTGNPQGIKAGAKGSRTLQKGVAQVIKPERRGRKAKTTTARVG